VIAPEPVEAADDVAQSSPRFDYASDRGRFQRELVPLQGRRPSAISTETRHIAAAHSGNRPAVHAAKAALRRLERRQRGGPVAGSRRKNILIIDGQHRLAALHVYERTHPDEARSINVPCVIFDGRSEDFATEDVCDHQLHADAESTKAIWWTCMNGFRGRSADPPVAAHIAEMLYREGTARCATGSNRLGAAARQEKWILQAELYNELHSLGETGLG